MATLGHLAETAGSSPEGGVIPLRPVLSATMAGPIWCCAGGGNWWWEMRIEELQEYPSGLRRSDRSRSALRTVPSSPSGIQSGSPSGEDGRRLCST